MAQTKSRPTPHRALFAVTTLVLATCWTLPAPCAAEFRAGAATSNITPPIGGDIIGGFSPAPSTHVHDELQVRCLVLDDGQAKLAIAVCDLVGIHHLVCQQAKKLIQESVGIQPVNVLISATHTHSASSALGRDRFQHQDSLDDYQKFVAQRIADGVRRAINNLRPAELAVGAVQAPEHVFNRRWYMKPGTMPENPFGGFDQVKMNPPAGSPNLTEPAGPTDPTISFLAVREPKGKPISLFAAYSLHYVGGVGSGHISADYFAEFCDQMTHLLQVERQDPPFVAIMANGTSGDINNINFRQPRPRQQPYEQIRHVAHDVAGKVHATLSGLKYQQDIRLAARFREPEIAWRKPTAEQLDWAKKTVAAGPKAGKGADLSYIYAQRVQRLADYPDTTVKIPLQVLAIGDVCIGTMPCEVFCETGMEFRERAPLKPAFMVELANGSFGYLPTPRHHKLGGYETWIGTNRLETEASEKMLATLLDMAAEIKKEREAK